MIEIIGINERYVVRKEDIRYMSAFEEEYFIFIKWCCIGIKISKEEYFRLVEKLKEGE